MQRALRLSSPSAANVGPATTELQRPARSHDLRLFMTTFVAGFCVFYGLIA